MSGSGAHLGTVAGQGSCKAAEWMTRTYFQDSSGAHIQHEHMFLMRGTDDYMKKLCVLHQSPPSLLR